jgi:signal transduction histidine kinase
LLRLLSNWRDWNIPAKLAAVTLVPVVFAIVLGAMQIGDQVRRADAYRQADRLITAGEALRSLVNALQRERTLTTAALAATQPPPTTAVAGEQRSTDAAREVFLRAARRATFHNEVTSARYAGVGDRLGELTRMREELAAGRVDAPGALAGYTAVIGSLLSFERSAGAEVIDPLLAGTALAVHDLEMVREEIRYQQALVGVGLTRGGLADEQLAALRASQARLADRVAEFGVDANTAQRQDFAAMVSGPAVPAREKLVWGVLSSGPPVINAADWAATSEDVATRADALADRLGGQLRDRSRALQDEASDGAGLASVLLLVALVVAAAVMLVVGRHLLRSLNLLRHSALDVAEHGLPEAVERIRDGSGLTEPVIEPVPVRSADEVGQVARAFDAVHRQALRLATEQAGLRARFGDVFVNLSRRSQGLVQRQLQLLERLERDEEDPEQLATLFQLDHLATRMRRNNENLMVLSGSELGRRNQRPATLSDLLRAAVSEIEQYQRVVLLPPPDVLIVGYAVGDLVRLVAELLDNATAFSAPGTQVTIASHSFDDDSVTIAILDEGIGMSESELAAANAKLADARVVDVSTSRRMGLFVVGRLAGRHGVEVSLHGGKNIPGVRATVTLPADLVTAPAPDSEPSRPDTNGHANGAVNGAVNGVKPSPLPRRTPPDIGRRLAGEEEPAEPPGAAAERAVPDGRPAAAGPPESPAGPADGAADTERTPLPRRSPGSSRFVKPVDTAAGPVDLATSGPPAPPTGSLFLPDDSGWWDAAGQNASLEETTPIFDEMLSAWFRAITDRAAEEESPPQEPWRFAADAGFLAAQAVSESQPETFTDRGLPRRNPRQNLVPGSVGSSEVDPAASGRDPGELRERLSQYQQGVSRARDERLVADDAGAAGGPPTLDLSGAGWRFSADPTVSDSGLPRRAPRGPAWSVGGDGGNPPGELDAQALRGRLGNFQRGLSRGRRSLAELAERARVLGDDLAAGTAQEPMQEQESE